MDNAEYLDRLLLRYAGSFDIYKPYTINGVEYPAYGYFFSCVEKYVLTQEANLWKARSYEHILFLDVEELLQQHIDEISKAISGYIEPKLICKGQSTPGKDHMYSYITVIAVCGYTPQKEVLKAWKRFKYEKGYRFNLEGYSQAHLALVCMDEEKIYTNYQGRVLKKTLREVFRDVREGKPGFDEVCARQGITCRRQEEQDFSSDTLMK